MNDVLPASFGRGDDFFGLNHHQRTSPFGNLPKSLDTRSSGRSRQPKMADEGQFSGDNNNSSMFGYYSAPPPTGYHESYPEAPEMIPGPPLLNNGEAHFIESFLENPGANYGNNDTPQLGNMNFDKNDYSWLMSERPPTIQGVAGEPSTSQAFSSLSHAHAPIPDFTTLDDSNLIAMGAEDDFFSVASFMNNANPFSTLMGSDAHHQHLHHHHHRDSLSDHSSLGQADPMSAMDNQQIDIVPSSISPNFVAPPIPALDTATPGIESNGVSRAPTPTIQRVFGLIPLSPVQTSPEFRDSVALNSMRRPRQHNHNPPADAAHNENTRLYRFGSDSHFSTTGFIPPAGQETEEVFTNRFMSTMNAIRPETGADTRPSTPPNGTHPTANGNGNGPIPAWAGTFIESDSESNNDRPRKRRRATADPSESSDRKPALHLRTALNPRKPSLASASGQSPTSATTKRRRSDVSGGVDAQRTPAKTPRENLSDAQKRNNHIMSEQKRRNLIKMGFDELHLLVPELRGGGFSKSSVLMESAIFLEKLVVGNRELREMTERARG